MLRHSLKPALKRGALIAAANWPLVVVQFVAESSLKLMLAVPIVGGAFLVALLLDASLSDLLRGDAREIVTSIVASLMQSPFALAAFSPGVCGTARHSLYIVYPANRGGPDADGDDAGA